MNNNTTDTKKAQKTTDKVFELTWFDKQGYIDKYKLARFIFMGSVAIYIVIVQLIMAIYAYTKFEYNLFKSQENFIQFEQTIVDWYISNMESLHSLSQEFIILNSGIFFLLLFISLKLTDYVKEKARMQSALSSIGLNQFYVEKVDKNTHTYTFKLIKGEKLNYDYFKDKSGNLKQIFGYQNSIAKRLGTNRIIVQFSENFPEIKDLKGLNVKNFQVKGKIFMGIGLPEIGIKIDKKDLIQNKFIPKYIEFEDLPQGIGNYGSASFGKSNTLNMVFQGIFMNFNKVKSFTFIDFKQGLEAEPYRLLELKKKTGRIFTMEDDRLKLLNYLEKLEIITKSRGLYIKDKGFKKIKGKAIITFFDEMAEVLDYEPKEKQEKLIQNRIYQLIESLLRIGRAAGIIIGYSTQSPLQHTSGLSSGMKNNTPLRITHGLTSSSQVSSVYEDLQELGYNPVDYDIGKLAVINTTNSTIFESRALFVPDDFTKDIEFEANIEDEFDTEIKEYYKQYVEQEKVRMEKMNIDLEDRLFSLDELLSDLLNDKLVNDNLYNNKMDEPLYEKNATSAEPPKQEPKKSVKIDFKSKASDYKKREIKHSTDKEVQDFLNLTENITQEDTNKLDKELEDTEFYKDIDKTINELDAYEIENLEVSEQESADVQKLYNELNLDIPVEKSIKEKRIDIDFI